MKIESWIDVDKALGELGRCDLEIAMLQGEIGVKIHELIEQYRERLQVLKAKREAIRATIESFCLERKEEFLKKRSRQFTFGKVAWRLSEEIEIPKGLEKAVLATVKKLGLHECVRVKEELDKNALKKLPDKELVRIGVQKHKKDNFRIEPNLEMIAEKVGVAMPSLWADVEKVSRAIKRMKDEGSEEVKDGNKGKDYARRF